MYYGEEERAIRGFKLDTVDETLDRWSGNKTSFRYKWSWRVGQTELDRKKGLPDRLSCRGKESFRTVGAGDEKGASGLLELNTKK